MGQSGQFFEFFKLWLLVLYKTRDFTLISNYIFAHAFKKKHVLQNLRGQIQNFSLFRIFCKILIRNIPMCYEIENNKLKNLRFSKNGIFPKNTTIECLVAEILTATSLSYLDYNEKKNVLAEIKKIDPFNKSFQKSRPRLRGWILGAQISCAGMSQSFRWQKTTMLIVIYTLELV